MAADTAGGGLGQLEDHYNTFVVRVFGWMEVVVVVVFWCWIADWFFLNKL